MKVIILLGGYGTRMRPHTWSRPKPLLHVAGNTVLGHILDQMSEITTGEVIFVVGYKGDQIEQWVRENYPQMDAHFVLQAEALGQAHAVWLCADYLQDDEDVVLAFGDGVVQADFARLKETGDEKGADAVIMVQAVDDPSSFGVVALNDAGYVADFVEKPEGDEHNLAIAGINWFRHGRELYGAVDRVMKEGRKTLGEYFMVDAYEVMLEEGAEFVTQEIDQWSDAGQPENILETNMRLLAVGYNTPDAIERSYAEDFTVLPPVYIHADATISGSVIGPYATIDREAVIEGSVVRNSIIDRGAKIENCILDGALVGEEAAITGRAHSLFVGDNSVVALH